LESIMPSRTIARLFDEYEDAAHAVRELEAAGISHGDISIVANNAQNQILGSGDGGNEAVPGAEIGAGVGAVAGGGAGVLAGLGLLAIPGVGPVVAAGWLVALAVGAAGGAAAGGLLGGLVGAGLSDEHAEVFIEGVRRGGTLVTVRVDDGQVAGVDAILDRNAVDPVSRRAEYAASGWSAFDPNGPVVTQADIDRKTSAGRL
jgi:hypothetical protein